MKLLRIAGYFGIVAATCSAWGMQIGNNPPVPPSWSQRPGQSPTPNVKAGEPVETAQERMIRERTAAMAATRQQEARTEAAKLLELATELKQQVDGSTSTTVSAASGKAPETADAIIKLAKSIKSKSRAY